MVGQPLEEPPLLLLDPPLELLDPPLEEDVPPLDEDDPPDEELPEPSAVPPSPFVTVFPPQQTSPARKTGMVRKRTKGRQAMSERADGHVISRASAIRGPSPAPASTRGNQGDPLTAVYTRHALAHP
jgi:hypothetical protein